MSLLVGILLLGGLGLFGYQAFTTKDRTAAGLACVTAAASLVYFF